MNRVYNAFRFAEVIAAAVCLATVIGLVFWATVTRFLATPNIWGIEITQIFFAWTCALSASIAFRRSSHFSVDLLSGWLPEGNKFWMGILRNVLVFCLVMGVVYVSLDFVHLSRRRPLPLTRIPFSWVAASISVAFAMMGVTCIENIARLVAERLGSRAKGEL